MENDQGQTAQQESGKTPWVCPYARIDETSQVIRRKDLVDLGETFKVALSPIAALVETNKEQNTNMSALLHEMQKQSRHMARIQRWMVGIAVSAVLGIAAHLSALWSLRNITIRVDSTTTQLDEMAKQVAQAEKAASEARSEAQTISSVQASQPRVELVPETDPKKAEEAPVRIRVVAPAASVMDISAPPPASSKAAKAVSGAVPTPAPARPQVTAEIPIAKGDLKSE